MIFEPGVGRRLLVANGAVVVGEDDRLAVGRPAESADRVIVGAQHDRLFAVGERADDQISAAAAAATARRRPLAPARCRRRCTADDRTNATRVPSGDGVMPVSACGVDHTADGSPPPTATCHEIAAAARSRRAGCRRSRRIRAPCPSAYLVSARAPAGRTCRRRRRQRCWRSPRAPTEMRRAVRQATTPGSTDGGCRSAARSSARPVARGGRGCAAPTMKSQMVSAERRARSAENDFFMAKQYTDATLSMESHRRTTAIQLFEDCESPCGQLSKIAGARAETL